MRLMAKLMLLSVIGSAGAAEWKHFKIIEEGVGPSNVHVLHEAGRDIIVSANRERAEAALYIVTGAPA